LHIPQIIHYPMYSIAVVVFCHRLTVELGNSLGDMGKQ